MDMAGVGIQQPASHLRGVTKVKRENVILNVIVDLAIVIMSLLLAVRYYNRGNLSSFWVAMGIAISFAASGVLYLVEREDLRKVIRIVSIVGIIISGRYLLLGT